MGFVGTFELGPNSCQEARNFLLHRYPLSRKTWTELLLVHHLIELASNMQHKTMGKKSGNHNGVGRYVRAGSWEFPITPLLFEQENWTELLLVHHLIELASNMHDKPSHKARLEKKAA